MAADRQAQATALRDLAKRIEDTEGDLPDDVAEAVRSILDLLELEDAARDWHEREARGEKAIPSAEVRRILGF